MVSTVMLVRAACCFFLISVHLRHTHSELVMKTACTRTCPSTHKHSYTNTHTDIYIQTSACTYHILIRTYLYGNKHNPRISLVVTGIMTLIRKYRQSVSYVDDPPPTYSIDIYTISNSFSLSLPHSLFLSLTLSFLRSLLLTLSLSCSLSFSHYLFYFYPLSSSPPYFMSLSLSFFSANQLLFIVQRLVDCILS